LARPRSLTPIMMAVTCTGTVVSSVMSCAEHPTCMTKAERRSVTGPRPAAGLVHAEEGTLTRAAARTPS
jgi:hypothetical protein